MKKLLLIAILTLSLNSGFCQDEPIWVDLEPLFRSVVIERSTDQEKTIESLLREPDLHLDCYLHLLMLQREIYVIQGRMDMAARIEYMIIDLIYYERD